MWCCFFGASSRRDLVPPTGPELMCCTNNVDLWNNVVLSFQCVSYILLLLMHYVCKLLLVSLNQVAPETPRSLIRPPSPLIARTLQGICIAFIKFQICVWKKKKCFGVKLQDNRHLSSFHMFVCVHMCFRRRSEYQLLFFLSSQIHESQWFMLWGFSISHLPFCFIIWKRVVLTSQAIPFYWLQHEQKWWSMSKRVPRRLLQKVILFFSIL